MRYCYTKFLELHARVTHCVMLLCTPPASRLADLGRYEVTNLAERPKLRSPDLVLRARVLCQNFCITFSSSAHQAAFFAFVGVLAAPDLDGTPSPGASCTHWARAGLVRSWRGRVVRHGRLCCRATGTRCALTGPWISHADVITSTGRVAFRSGIRGIGTVVDMWRQTSARGSLWLVRGAGWTPYRSLCHARAPVNVDAAMTRGAVSSASADVRHEHTWLLRNQTNAMRGGYSRRLI